MKLRKCHICERIVVGACVNKGTLACVDCTRKPVCVHRKNKEEGPCQRCAEGRKSKRTSYYSMWYEQNAVRISQKRAERAYFIKLFGLEKYEEIKKKEAAWEKWRRYFAYNREKLSRRILRPAHMEKLDHLFVARHIGHKRKTAS